MIVRQSESVIDTSHDDQGSGGGCTTQNSLVLLCPAFVGHSQEDEKIQSSAISELSRGAIAATTYILQVRNRVKVRVRVRFRVIKTDRNVLK
jgi:hypothetical protein